MPRSEIARRKREVRARSGEERAHRRHQRLLYWRCFWTWPWGHAWMPLEHNEYYKQCAACAKLRNIDPMG